MYFNIHNNISSGVWFPERARKFSLLQYVTSRLDLKTVQAPIQRVPEVNQPGPEAAHSLPSNAAVNNKWRHTLTPTIRLHDLDRDSFNFTCSKLGNWGSPASYRSLTENTGAHFQLYPVTYQYVRHTRLLKQCVSI